MLENKRPYRSQRREAQAQETRALILAAARSLFTTRGYAGTTIEGIAAEAGVSPQTVYSAFKNKRGLLLALLDQMAVDADGEQQRPPSADDPRQQLREGIAFTTRFYSRGADLIELARTVSGVEADLGAMWQEGEGRRLRRYSQLTAEWERTGALGPGLTAAAARDVAWAMGGPDMFRLLVVERRWSLARYERWLGDTLERLLFGG